MTKYQAFFFPRAREYIGSLDKKEQGRVGASIDTMLRGDFDAVATKVLRTPIRELIVGNSRFTYFTDPPLLYFVSGFLKKSRKTPLQQIEYAQKIYKAHKYNEKGEQKTE